jgi:RNA 3'-terminal phosphate cyclase
VPDLPQCLIGLREFVFGQLLILIVVNRECPVDKYLQDQLVIYQCLAKGTTCFDSAGLKGGTESLDSTQTRNARKAATAMLPEAKYSEGNICIGAGVVVGDA